MFTSSGSDVSLSDVASLRAAVDSCLSSFLDRKAQDASRSGMPEEVVSLLRDFVLGGGKRLRPLLCFHGWNAAHGRGEPEALVHVAAALEMFHACALIHDDVMDRTDTRRNRPTVHRAVRDRLLSGEHRCHDDQLTRRAHSTAVLLGDLALVWSDELFQTAGLSAAQRTAALAVLHQMRTEVMYGQYLDLLSTGCPTTDLAVPLQVIRYKTAKYTIERPLHLGALLAGASQQTLRTLSHYALPLGTAFQLRDDLLGVFGDPAVTGKPAHDDLREGKYTALIVLAMRRAPAEGAARLGRLLGDPLLTDAQAEEARAIISAAGADRATEHMIRRLHEESVQALDSGSGLLSADGTRALQNFAHHAALRTS
ncbi:polyprenyl synthetase family protein [Streptomyces sp. NPDC048290]|uniref:polyprenyl synthetase family protein n=1 Tax=Streptomyces sp. NPDC048290 TaxID=3155811 RepID=UPI00344139C9